MLKKSLVITVLSLLSSAALAQNPDYGRFIASPGESIIKTSRAKCGSVKEKAYFHEIVLHTNGSFTEKLYMSGIVKADVVMTGLWEERRKVIELSYDGAINEGSSGLNTGWAPFLLDVERTLSAKCRATGIGVLSPTVNPKKQILKIKDSGKANYKMTFKALAAADYNRPRSITRKVSAKGYFVGNSQ